MNSKVLRVSMRYIISYFFFFEKRATYKPDQAIIRLWDINFNSFGFKMDMLDGKYWGNYKKMNEEIYDEDFFADFEDYIFDHNKVGILYLPQ